LLENSYRWVLEHPDFKQWRNEEQIRLLWIKGDPGKGKTMLLCGIINELKRTIAKTNLLSFFFCEETDSRNNNAVAVLRGLLYLLVDQRPSLISHVRKKYDHAGQSLFDDANTWIALSDIFIKSLQDLSLNSTCLIVDALDECEHGLPRLLELIVRVASTLPHVKWIVSSRNISGIQQKLDLDDGQRNLCLELHANHVSQAVEAYIDYKMSQLLSLNRDAMLQDKVRKKVRAKAGGTFLWISLVFQELEMVEPWDILQVLDEIPADLHQLYGRMLKQVQQQKRKDPELCSLILSTVTLAYRPLHLLELGALAGLPRQISHYPDGIIRIVAKCGSFLTIRDDFVYFIHQSAKDYLNSSPSDTIFETFLSRRGSTQYNLFLRSIQAMSETLRKDMYNLGEPGITTKSVQVPNPDPLRTVQYPCIYWGRHLQEAYEDSLYSQPEITDDGEIHQFLQSYFLYWLEALSLIGEVSAGVLLLHSLESYILVSYLDATHGNHAKTYLRQSNVPVSTHSSMTRRDSSCPTGR
jgi:hypothetical protein